jgi:hypothetical protein
MPVRIRVKVDQRRLHRVLAECGNSRLPIEIRQVRINRPPAASNDTGGGMGDMGGAMAGGSFGPPGVMGGEDMGGMGGMFGGAGRPGRVAAVGDASVDPNLIDIELYGIVLIYNPVNRSQLGLPYAPVTAMAPGVPAVPITPTTAPATPPATTGAAVSPVGTTVAGS